MTTRTIKAPEPSLDRARKALAGMGDALRTGGRDLYGDLTKFVRSTRKHTAKLATALRGDAEQLIKAAAPPPPAKRAKAAAHPKPRRAAPRHARKAPPAAPRERAAATHS